MDFITVPSAELELPKSSAVLLNVQVLLLEQRNPAELLSIAINHKKYTLKNINQLIFLVISSPIFNSCCNANWNLFYQVNADAEKEEGEEFEDSMDVFDDSSSSPSGTLRNYPLTCKVVYSYKVSDFFKKIIRKMNCIKTIMYYTIIYKTIYIIL